MIRSANILLISAFVPLALAQAQTSPQPNHPPDASGIASLTLDAAIEKALTQSPDTKEAEAQLRRAEFAEKLALSPFLPQIALEGGTLQRGPSDENESGTFYYGVGRWNLYNGGVDAANQQIQRLEQTKFEHSLDLARQRVSRDVTRRFAELLYFDEALRLKREALELNRAQMQIAKRKASGGLTSNADVLEFEFRENALNTEISLLQHERSLSSRELAKSIGDEPTSTLSLNGTLSPDLAKAVVKPEASEAYLNESQLLEARTDVELARLAHDSSRSVWLPKADFEARYGQMEFADPEVIGTPGWRLELKFTLPLFSGLETIYARQATAATLREREARLKKAELAAKNTLADRNEKLTVLETLIKMQRENIARAERYYQATLAEYRRGVKNSPDLSGATERWFDARLRERELIKDVVMARMGLIEATTIDIP